MARAMPANNAAPVFPTGSSDARSVDENSPPGTRVGAPVAANDTPGETLTYTLGTGTDDGNYRIDPATGQITVGPRTMLNHEDNETDSVTVTATDPAGAAGTGATPVTVTITINDVNEAPVITAGSTRASVAETATIDTVDTYMVTDFDLPSVPVTWSLSGTDAGDFKISPDGGALTFEEAPNYEMPADSNGDNVYMVTVVATDVGVGGNNKMTAERAVVITVMNVDEMGTVTLSSEQPKVGIELTATLEDPDGVVADSVKWTWHAAVATSVTDADTGIPMATSATYTPEETGFLSARASYTDGHGANKSMVGGPTNNIAVVVNLANVAPKFPSSETGMREVAEDASAGTNINTMAANVGETDPVEATDANTDANTTDTLTYTLSGTDMASFDIDRESGQLETKAKLDYEAKSSYTVTVTATDTGNLSASIDVTIKVTDVDEAPEIAGDDITKDYPENGRAQVARFTADDPEGRMIYWSLLSSTAAAPEGITPGVDSADAGDLSISASGVLSFNIPPDFEAPQGGQNGDSNTYNVVVVASDDAPDADVSADAPKMGYKKVTVNVTNVQEAETITLSARQAQVAVALTATYNDLDNEKPIDTNLTWKWYLGGSPIPLAVESSYTPDSGGSLRVEASYTRTDGTAKTVSKTINVRTVPAVANATPVFPTGSSDARSVDENSPPGTRVGAPVAANDTPGETLTYTLGTGTDDGNYRIDPATGQITVGPRTMLDRELNGALNENDMVTVTATDPWGAAGVPTGVAMQTVTITINDVNEAPVITAGSTRASVAETATIDTVDTYMVTDFDLPSVPVTWSLSGTDAGDFKISPDGGALTFEEAPNYEMPADSNGDNVYMVTVVATDVGVGGNNKMTAERAVVITVMNVDEMGTVTLSSVQPKVGIELTATLEDPDGVVADSVKWTWHAAVATSVTDADTGIPMATSATYTPEETGFLTVRASYTDGHGAGKSVIQQAVDVVVNLANVAPEFPATETGMREVAEDASAAVAIGVPVVATDANMVNGTAEILTYTLSGTDMASFDIVRSSGQLQTKAKLDHEDKNSYMVTVAATDPDGASASIDVTIKVTDVDEAPEILLGGLAIRGQSSINYAEDDTDPVATFTASGPDAASATWRLSGYDAGDFYIDRITGVLTFRGAPDFENPVDMNGDNVYMVTVNAYDGTYMDTHDVTVTVTNVDDPGTVTFWVGTDPLTGPAIVGEALTGLVVDADGSVTVQSWQWMKAGSAAGQFADITGATLASYTPVEADASMYIKVMATYTDAEGSGKTAESPSVMVTVADVDEPGTVTLWVGTDALTGPAIVGEELTGLVVDSDGSVTDQSWQWMKADSATGQFADIIGATSASYTPVEADASMYIKVMATYTDAEGSGKTAESPSVMVTVADVDEPGTVTLWVGTDALTGPAIVGEELTGLVVDSDGSVTDQSWQWMKADSAAGQFADIIGATSASYTPVEADASMYIKVMATYTDAEGSGKTAESPSVMVQVEAAPMTLLERYDADNSGRIDKDEAIQAINDYLFGVGADRISKDEAIQVINLYLFG